MDSNKSYYACSECGRVFAFMSYLTEHMNACRASICVLNTCNVCGKICARKSSLSRHMKVHGEKPFNCVECGRTFTQKSTLNQHMKVHSSSKPFNCDVCGKSFFLESTLIQHVRLHTGDRPFKCVECGETFSWKSDLSNHKLLYYFHDQPFCCNECGKTFVTKCGLREHLITTNTCEGCVQEYLWLHSSDKPFKCVECGETFTRKSDLSNHKRLYYFHDRPFGCNECRKTFVAKCALREHLMTSRSCGGSRKASTCQLLGNVDETKSVTKHSEDMKTSDEYSKSLSNSKKFIKLECADTYHRDPAIFVKMEGDSKEHSDLFLQQGTDSIKIEIDPLDIKDEASSW